jgi:hypothetical protein
VQKESMKHAHPLTQRHIAAWIRTLERLYLERRVEGDRGPRFFFSFQTVTLSTPTKRTMKYGYARVSTEDQNTRRTPAPLPFLRQT